MSREPDLSEDRLLGQLVDELLDLRRAVAETLGREQYLYQVLDDAIESRHLPALSYAKQTYEHQPDEVKEIVNSNVALVTPRLRRR